MSAIDKYCVTGSDFDLKDFPTKASDEIKEKKDELIKATNDNLETIAVLQDKLYADAKEGLLVVIQAMDAAGKDSTVKNVMSSINPQGVDVYSFKQPSKEESGHDFMWRATKVMPIRGKIGIFNRSYYEDVLVVKVHDIFKNYAMPKRCLDGDKDKFFERRYKHIKNFEDYYHDEGYRIVKIFLNVSKDEQKQRFLDRIEIEAKNWKFSDADIKERGFWKDYMDAYEDAIKNTATKDSPWFVLPADSKWYTRYLVSEILIDVLKKMDPHYPEVSDEQKQVLLKCKEALDSEK